MHRTVGERIRDRRKKLGISGDDVAEALGRDRSTYYRYERGDIENLPYGVLQNIAKVLRVSEGYLITGEHPPSFKRIPVLGTIAAGEPILAVEEMADFVEVYSGSDVDFCLRVTGDSMIDARIHDGDLVFVRRQPVVENGEIAAVLIDEEVTLKRFYRNEGVVILKPENSRYQPTFYSERNFKHVRVLGRAVLFQSLL